MDLFDVIWNLFRKSLTDSAYDWGKRSVFGRPGHHFSIDTYRIVADEYAAVLLSCHNKNILEVGPGRQFYTGFYFLSRGAKSVSLADPVFDGCPENQLEHDRKQFMLRERTYVGGEIQRYPSMNAIPVSENGTFDIVCSRFALEHIRDAEDFFRQSARLLKPGGICYHFVDLSDHAYHLFDSRPCTRWLYRSRMLYHLRYSDTFFNLITDKRIWVNRLLLPAYRGLWGKYNLTVQFLKPHFFNTVTIHRDVLEKNPTNDRADLSISHFGFCAVK